jgi:hypothetical protein
LVCFDVCTHCELARLRAPSDDVWGEVQRAASISHRVGETRIDVDDGSRRIGRAIPQRSGAVDGEEGGGDEPETKEVQRHKQGGMQSAILQRDEGAKVSALQACCLGCALV